MKKKLILIDQLEQSTYDDLVSYQGELFKVNKDLLLEDDIAIYANIPLYKCVPVEPYLVIDKQIQFSDLKVGVSILSLTDDESYGEVYKIEREEDIGDWWLTLNGNTYDRIIELMPIQINHEELIKYGQEQYEEILNGKIVYHTVTPEPKTQPLYKEEEMLDNMQYYMEYCQREGYISPKDWLTKKKHF